MNELIPLKDFVLPCFGGWGLLGPQKSLNSLEELLEGETAQSDPGAGRPRAGLCSAMREACLWPVPCVVFLLLG